MGHVRQAGGGSCWGDLAVPSNTTIDASGAGVELYGHGLKLHRRRMSSSPDWP